MAVNIQLQQENNPQKQISRGQSVIPLITAAMPLCLSFPFSPGLTFVLMLQAETQFISVFSLGSGP